MLKKSLSKSKSFSSIKKEENKKVSESAAESPKAESPKAESPKARPGSFSSLIS